MLNTLLGRGLRVGEKAPDFELPSQDGTRVRGADMRGKAYLLYFYPKDFTPGCTAQGCSLQEGLADFNELSLPVLGVSTDSVESHKSFAEKHSIKFPLLSDGDKSVARSFGVLLPIGVSNRVSFLIGADGVIRKKFNWLSGSNYAQRVLKVLREEPSLLKP